MCQLLVDGNRIYDFIAQKDIVICIKHCSVSSSCVSDRWYFPRFYSCAVFLKNLHIMVSKNHKISLKHGLNESN